MVFLSRFLDKKEVAQLLQTRGAIMCKLTARLNKEEYGKLTCQIGEL